MEFGTDPEQIARLIDERLSEIETRRGETWALESFIIRAYVDYRLKYLSSRGEATASAGIEAIMDVCKAHGFIPQYGASRSEAVLVNGISHSGRKRWILAHNPLSGILSLIDSGTMHVAVSVPSDSGWGSVSSDDAHLAVHKGGKIAVLRLADLRIVARCPVFPNSVKGARVCWSRDGQRVAIGDGRSLKALNIPAGAAVMDVRSSAFPVAFCGDRSILAVDGTREVSVMSFNGTASKIEAAFEEEPIGIQTDDGAVVTDGRRILRIAPNGTAGTLNGGIPEGWTAVGTYRNQEFTFLRRQRTNQGDEALETVEVATATADGRFRIKDDIRITTEPGKRGQERLAVFGPNVVRIETIDGYPAVRRYKIGKNGLSFSGNALVPSPGKMFSETVILEDGRYVILSDGENPDGSADYADADKVRLEARYMDPRTGRMSEQCNRPITCSPGTRFNMGGRVVAAGGRVYTDATAPAANGKRERCVICITESGVLPARTTAWGQLLNADENAVYVVRDNGPAQCRDCYDADMNLRESRDMDLKFCSDMHGASYDSGKSGFLPACELYEIREGSCVFKVEACEECDMPEEGCVALRDNWGDGTCFSNTVCMGHVKDGIVADQRRIRIAANWEIGPMNRLHISFTAGKYYVSMPRTSSGAVPESMHIGVVDCNGMAEFEISNPYQSMNDVDTPPFCACGDGLCYTNTDSEVVLVTDGTAVRRIAVPEDMRFCVPLYADRNHVLLQDSQDGTWYISDWERIERTDYDRSLFDPVTIDAEDGRSILSAQDTVYEISMSGIKVLEQVPSTDAGIIHHHYGVFTAESERDRLRSRSDEGGCRT